MAQEDRQIEEQRQFGRVIAQGMEEVRVQKEKNMAKAAKRRSTMLEKAAEKVLSGN